MLYKSRKMTEAASRRVRRLPRRGIGSEGLDPGAVDVGGVVDRIEHEVEVLHRVRVGQFLDGHVQVIIFVCASHPGALAECGDRAVSSLLELQGLVAPEGGEIDGVLPDLPACIAAGEPALNLSPPAVRRPSRPVKWGYAGMRRLSKRASS